MDVFELATKITTSGAAETQAALESVQKSGKATAAQLDLVKLGLEVVAAALAAKVVGSFLVDAAKAAGEAEQALGRLSVAVKNSGSSWKAIEPQAEAAAKSLESVSRFQNDQAVAALATLTTTTGSATKALQLLGLTADFAAAKGIDLSTSANIIGRVAAGSTAILSRYGIVVGKGGDALALLQQRFGGFAEQEGTTFLGTMSRVENSFHELLETIGNVIINNDALRYLLDRLIAAFQDAATWVHNNADALDLLVTGFTSLLVVVEEIVEALFYDLTRAWAGAEIVALELVERFENLGPKMRLALGVTLEAIATFVADAGDLFDSVFGTHISDSADRLAALGQQMRHQATVEIALNRQVLADAEDSLAPPDEGTAKGPGKLPSMPKTSADSKPFSDDELAAAKAALRAAAVQMGGAFVQAYLDTLDASEPAVRDIYAHVLGPTNFIAQAKDLFPQIQLQPSFDLAGLATAVQRFIPAYQHALDAYNVTFGHKLTPRLTIAPQLTPASMKALDDQAVAVGASVAESLKTAVDSVDPALSEAAVRAGDKVEHIFADLGPSLGDALGSALSAGFTKGLKAKDVLLQGLGAIFTQMGKALITFGLTMLKLLPFLTNVFTSGPAAIIAGAALVALGATLGNAATGGGSGGGGGGSSPPQKRLVTDTSSGTVTVDSQGRPLPNTPGSSAVAGASPTITPSRFAAPAGSAAAAAVTPAAAVTFNVFGPNDPQAQRAIADAYLAAKRRGLV